MKEHGCGRTMAYGYRCTTADEDVPPMLCRDCLAELVAQIEIIEMYSNHYGHTWITADWRAKLWANVRASSERVGARFDKIGP